MFLPLIGLIFHFTNSQEEHISCLNQQLDIQIFSIIYFGVGGRWVKRSSLNCLHSILEQHKNFFNDISNVHKERHGHDNSLKLITSSANCARLSLKA